MQINWHKAESASQPAEVDKGLSPNGVYLRKNITEVEHSGIDQQSPVTMYEYDEAFLTSEEYQAYLIADTVQLRHENDIIDDNTLQLVEEGVI